MPFHCGSWGFPPTVHNWGTLYSTEPQTVPPQRGLALVGWGGGGVCPGRTGGSSNGSLQDGRHRCVPKRTRCGPRIEHVLGCVRPGSVPTTAWCHPAHGKQPAASPIPSAPPRRVAWLCEGPTSPPHTRAGYGLPPCTLSGRRGAGLQNSHHCQDTPRACARARGPTPTHTPTHTHTHECTSVLPLFTVVAAAATVPAEAAVTTVAA